ncbi:MAG: ribbon-helix-helix protein, CopG family [Terriglobales bacterium]
MVKVTYTLDDETVERVRRSAERLGIAKSAVIREAVKEFEPHTDRLSEAERRRMLAILDAYAAKPPSRPDSDIDAELAELRWQRQHGGRRHPVE